MPKNHFKIKIPCVSNSLIWCSDVLIMLSKQTVSWCFWTQTAAAVSSIAPVPNHVDAFIRKKNGFLSYVVSWISTQLPLSKCILLIPSFCMPSQTHFDLSKHHRSSCNAPLPCLNWNSTQSSRCPRQLLLPDFDRRAPPRPPLSPLPTLWTSPTPVVPLLQKSMAKPPSFWPISGLYGKVGPISTVQLIALVMAFEIEVGFYLKW